MSKDWAVPRELAEEVGVSIDKVHAWLASGELEGVNLAANAKGERPRWRVSRAAWKRFLASRTPVAA